MDSLTGAGLVIDAARHRKLHFLKMAATDKYEIELKCEIKIRLLVFVNLPLEMPPNAYRHFINH